MGDIDGDGDLDALLPGVDHDGFVWINDGGGTYEAAAPLARSDSMSGWAGGFGVALGDIDGDGDLDAIIQLEAQGLTVFMNDGSGSFTESSLVSESNFSDFLVGDLDGDGDLDIVAVGYEVRTYLNDGAGTFNDSGTTLTLSSVNSAALADLDGDGDLDVFVARRAFTEGAPDVVLMNDGAGHLGDSGQALGNKKTEGVALGDVNADGHVDAVTADLDGASQVWLNDGSGTFTDSGQTLGTAWDVAMGDVEGDGDLDIVVLDPNSRSTIWLNDGVGGFSDSGQDLGSLPTAGAALVDVDGDGDLDLFIGATNREGIRVWINR